MPEQIPHIAHATLISWRNLPFRELCFHIMRLFVGEELSALELRAAIDSAYGNFSAPETVPLVKIGDITVCELFHGPTLSFKDIALQVIGQLLQTFLRKRNDWITVLVGTSGDTGSAAAHAVKGAENIDYFCLYPKGRVSRVQELQLTRMPETNIHMVAVDGTSDDLDVPIKQLFDESEFRATAHLCSINSVNWCRIAVQTVHYFYAYLHAVSEAEIGSPVLFSVPTGALGNIASGLVAQTMGLNVQLLAATNTNDVIPSFIHTGRYAPGQTVVTLSTAMDIQAPYNVERLLYIVSGADTTLVRQLMDDVTRSGVVTVSGDLLQKIQTAVQSRSVTVDEAIATARRWYMDMTYLLCPHTAVAVTAAERVRASIGSDIPTVVLASAHPGKFEEATSRVLQDDLKPLPPISQISALESQQERCAYYDTGSNWREQLRADVLEAIAHRCSI
eukprot:TRINITY_DN9458_c0_g1_i1.p1 TRINITY_DN9458_c0_g1~~TRINITY_DN9458_c0_g1_i1.p1  ORF type:complete len:448 (-),score=73.44 TRINITY_DN9458_c0_g1_i1:21-1364(-)